MPVLENSIHISFKQDISRGEKDMGTWGSGSFENDDASDWVAGFCDDPDEASIIDALSTPVETDGYLEAPECNIAIAAAEVVAALHGTPNPDLPEEAKECMATLRINADGDMVALALRAIERIGRESELKELWKEGSDSDEWYKAIDDLKNRLGSDI